MQKFVRLMLFGLCLLAASACEQISLDYGVVVTPEVTPEVSNISLSGEYFLTVSDIVDEYLPDTTPEVPEGFKWVLVTASVSNTTGPTITVAEDALSVVDDAGVRYLAETPDAATTPPLIGAVVPAGEGVRGLARFAIPEDTTPALLEWCLDAMCEQRLTISLPPL